MKVIQRKDIKEELKICPFCGYPQKDKLHCCNETRFEDAYLVGDEYFLASEVTIEESTKGDQHENGICVY